MLFYVVSVFFLSFSLCVCVSLNDTNSIIIIIIVDVDFVVVIFRIMKTEAASDLNCAKLEDENAHTRMHREGQMERDKAAQRHNNNKKSSNTNNTERGFEK